MARKIKCKKSYHEYKVGDIPIFFGGVRAGIYGNPTTFMTPPFTEAIFIANTENYTLKRDAYKNGGIAQKGDYLTAENELMTMLDTTADYVDTVANGNAAIILDGGYVPTKGSSSAVVAPLKPEGVTLVRTNNNLELASDCTIVAGAEAYGAVLTAEPLDAGVIISPWGQITVRDDEGTSPAPALSSATSPIKYVLDLNKNRRKIFTGLQIGTTYYVYYWAVNAAGVSPLSEGASRKVVEL
jgi:hypothetical protein